MHVSFPPFLPPASIALVTRKIKSIIDPKRCIDSANTYADVSTSTYEKNLTSTLNFEIQNPKYFSQKCSYFLRLRMSE